MSAPRRLSPVARALGLAALHVSDGVAALDRALRRRIEIAVIRRSALFDAAWYLAQNPDVATAGADPARHFRDHGVAEGRDPSAAAPLPALTSLSRAARGNPLVWHELQERPGMDAATESAVRATRLSPFFDPHWYLERNRDVAAAGIDPALHYALHGWRERRDPGPQFDAAFYEEQMGPQERGALFPLAHAAEGGQVLEMVTIPAARPVPAALPVGPLRAPSALAGRFRIGVIAHVFYPDLAPRLAQALRALPVDFTLFVSTDSDAKHAAIEAAFGGLPRAARLVVRTTPNRGRDVAPMLIAFGEELLACDLALHLHTKRSPYGAQLHGWLDHCLDHLLHSEIFAEAVLRAFDADPDLGVFYAPPFPPIMRFMAWAGMRERAEALLERLDLPRTTLAAFPLDFPASTMMWFRPGALRQLFESGLDWDDFPDEAGQTNDTTAHVIERLVFYIAHANGFGRRCARPARFGDAFALRLSPPPEAPMTIPAATAPRVSIVVPVFNQWSDTAACLRAVVEHTDPETTPYEVILGDDASTDATLDAATAFPGLRVVRGENVGFLNNVNRAAAEARGEYILLLNNDTQVQPGWLDALTEGFAARPDAAVVGAKLIYPDGVLQEAGGVIWRDATGLNYGRDDADPARPEYSYLREVDYVSAAAILVDGAFWRARGGFDTRFSPAYYEDTDLCFAARAEGRRVYLHPGALVAHFEGRSHGTDTGGGVKRHQAINRQTFAAKWRTALAADHHTGAQLARARERAMDRKVIAVIDWEPPEYDRHAGGRYVWDYLRLMVEAGHAVKFLACRLSDPHQLDILAEMRRMGVEAHDPGRYWTPIDPGAWLRDRVGDVDAALLSRPNVAEPCLPVCRAAGTPAIYLCHDLESVRLRRAAEQAGDAAGAINAASVEANERRLIGAVDLTFTPSPVELRTIREDFGVDAAMLLPVYVMRDGPPARTAAPAGAELLFVGGMEHAPNPDGLAWFLDAVWPRLRTARPDAVLHVVGRSAPAWLLNKAGRDVRFHGAIPEAALRKRYATARVVIAPLRFGAGVKGKVVEAMRHGVPIIGTSVALEGVEPVIPPADTAEAFADAARDALAMDDAAWLRTVAEQASVAMRGFGVDACRLRLAEGLDVAFAKRTSVAPDRKIAGAAAQ